MLREQEQEQSPPLSAAGDRLSREQRGVTILPPQEGELCYSLYYPVDRGRINQSGCGNRYDTSVYAKSITFVYGKLVPQCMTLYMLNACYSITSVSGKIIPQWVDKYSPQVMGQLYFRHLGIKGNIKSWIGFGVKSCHALCHV